MEFNLYPRPTLELVTPFVFDSNTKEFCRLFKHKNEIKKITVKSKNEKFYINGIKKEKLFGKRIPDRKKLLNYLKKRSSKEFLNYIENNLILPSFSLSPEEALVRTIIKQLISAKQARRLISIFIQTFGYYKDNLYFFPNIDDIKEIKISELQKLGFGFKAERIINGINQFNTDKNFSNIKGIGKWSKEILNVELNKDFCYYPFWDISSNKINKLLGFNPLTIALRNRELAGDLHLYSLSFFEVN